MGYKKLLKTTLFCIAFVWVFCGLLMFMTSNQKKEQSQSMQESFNSALSSMYNTTASTLPTATTVPTTTAPKLSDVGNQAVTSADQVGDPDWLVNEQASISASVSQSQVDASISQSKAEQTTEAAAKIPSTKAEIIKTYTDAVNALKANQNFSLVKTDTLEIILDKMPGGGMFDGIAQDMISAKSPKEPYIYDFVGGIDATSKLSPNDTVAPLKQPAALNESGVTEATATPTSDGGMNIEIKLADELQTMQVPATNHAGSVQVIDVDDLGLPSAATLTKLDITYSGTVIKATIDKDGKITYMYHILPVKEAIGEGKMLISVAAKIHGEYTSKYEITYK